MKVQLTILLKNLLMKYDGLGNFVIHFCLEILEFFINDQDPKMRFKYIDINSNIPVFKMKIEDNIDIALLILGVIENYLKHFPNQRYC